MQALKKYFENKLQSKTIAIWCDDSLYYPTVVNELLAEGAFIKMFLSGETVRNDIELNHFISADQYDCLVGADALIIASESLEFSEPDFLKIVKAMNRKVIFALPDIFESYAISQLGFHYERIDVAS